MQICKIIKRSIFTIIIGIFCIIKVKQILNTYGMTPDFSDYILMLWGGFGHFKDGKTIHMPVYMITFVIYLSVIAVRNIISEKKSRETLMLLKLGREKYWIRKCINCVRDVVSQYIIIMLLFLCASSGKINDGNDSGKMIARYLDSKIEFYYPSKSDFFLVYILIPIFILIGMFMTQNVLALVFNDTRTIIVIFLVIGLSIFIVNPVLPGNYIFILRSELYLKNGMNPLVGLVFGVLLCCVSGFVGMNVIRKKDII